MMKSPCIRNCCLNKEDICVGCFRHIKEIVGWSKLSSAEKIEIVERSEERKHSTPLINVDLYYSNEEVN